jgi:hypothetical protein
MTAKIIILSKFVSSRRSLLDLELKKFEGKIFYETLSSTRVLPQLN